MGSASSKILMISATLSPLINKKAEALEPTAGPVRSLTSEFQVSEWAIGQLELANPGARGTFLDTMRPRRAKRTANWSIIMIASLEPR
jgi:hypothetical protein